WWRRYSGTAGGRSFPRLVRAECRTSGAKSHPRFRDCRNARLDRAHRLHRRRWNGSFFPGEGRSEVLESSFRTRCQIWHETVWPGGARYLATGNVLPAQRLRPLTRSQSDRGWTRIFRRSGETKFHRGQKFPATIEKKPLYQKKS